MVVDEIDIPPRGIERQEIFFCCLFCALIGKLALFGCFGGTRIRDATLIPCVEPGADRKEEHDHGGGECDAEPVRQSTLHTFPFRCFASQCRLGFALGPLARGVGFGAFGALTFGLDPRLGLGLLTAQVAPLADHTGQQIVGQLYPLRAEALLDAQQAAQDQLVDIGTGHTRLA